MQANAFAAKFSARRIGASILSRGIIAFVLAALFISQAAAANITGVNVANKPDRVIVSVQGDAPLKMGVIPSSAGRFIAFQFAGQLTPQGRMVSIKSGKIHNIRYSKFQERPPATRIVFNTATRLDYSTSWNESKTRVEISVWKFGSNPQVKAAPAGDAELRIAASPTPPAARIQSDEPSKLTENLPALEEPEALVRVTPTSGQAAAAALPVASAPFIPPPAVEAPKPAPVAVVQKPAPVAVKPAKAAAGPASTKSGKRVSVNFLDADINDVLKAISTQSGENIVVGSDVTGKITVTLDAVTIDEALDYVTKLCGYTYLRDQNTYLVGSLHSLGGFAGSEIELVTLKYASADDVLEMLKVRCPHVRSSKISVLGGKARKHEQRMEVDQGFDATRTQAQANEGVDLAESEGQPSQGASSVKSTGGSESIGTIRESSSSSADSDSPPSNIIALSGMQDRIDEAKEFIAEVEEAMKAQADGKKISIYQVKYVNTLELANTIMSVVVGVSVMMAPSNDVGGLPVPATGAGQQLMPVSAISGENTGRHFDLAAKQFGNTLVIFGDEADVQKALDIAAQFDVQGDYDLTTYKLKHIGLKNVIATIRKLAPNVMIESAGLDPDDESSGASGGSKSAGGGSGASSDGELRQSGMDQTSVKQQAAMNAQAVDNLSRLLVISGRKSDVQKAVSIVEALDVKSPRIKIQAKFTSLTESGEKQLGLSWNWGEFNKVEVSRNHWQRQPVDFGAKLDAIISSGDGTLLAAPSLVCLEGKPGQFFVGDEIRFITQISSDVGGKPTVTTDTANVGVQLTVVGNVSTDDQITLNLHPEVSTLKLDDRMKSEAGITLPIITRRYTDHVVRVKNGETIVIGGLILDSELESLSKVPLLGDLPVLGHLFRHKNKTKEHSEVVVFITATVVDD